MGYQHHLFAGISFGLSQYGFSLECIDSTLRGDIHCRRYKASLPVSSIHPRHAPCCVDVYCDEADVSLLTGVYVGISWEGATLYLYELPMDIEWYYFRSVLGGDLWAATQLRSLSAVRSFLESHLPGVVRHASLYVPTCLLSEEDHPLYVCSSVSGEFREVCMFSRVSIVKTPSLEAGDDMDTVEVVDASGVSRTLTITSLFTAV